MHRIYLPTRKDTRYPYSSIAYLYSSEYVDKVKTQHALSGTCARFIQETHTHIRWCYTFTWKLPHLAELEVFRLERLRDELVLLGPELRGCRRGRHGRQAVQHLTNIKLLHFPPVRETEGDRSTESRSAVDDEGERRSRSFLQHVSLNLTF